MGRPHGACNDVPPAEYEAMFLQSTVSRTRGVKPTPASLHQAQSDPVPGTRGEICEARSPERHSEGDMSWFHRHDEYAAPAGGSS